MRGRAVAACLAVLVAAGCAGAPAVFDDTASPSVDESPTVEPQQEPTGTPVEAQPCDDPLGCYGQPEQIGAFDPAVLPEASGLAASRRNPGLLYLLDDRPGTSEVWVLGADATMLGAIEVDTLDAKDTEDLAVGPCGTDTAATCVYVGDIGDHQGARDGVLVHRFPEPDLSSEVPASVEADVVRLRYPQGWHDAETLLVDDDGVVFLVTKARVDRSSGVTGEHRLYRAPSFADSTLEDLGVVPVPEPSQPLHSAFVGNVVTGGDHRDGRVALRTYDQVLEFVAPPGQGDLADFPDWPVREVPSAVEPQSEAITWAVDRCGYLTASEQVGAVWFVPCADDRAP